MCFKWRNLIKFLTVLSLLGGLSACNKNIQVDGNPVSQFGGGRFIPTVDSCGSLILSGSVLPLSIYHIGLCYELGLSTPISKVQAIAFYQEAARWGVPEARVALQRLNQAVPEQEMRERQEDMSNIIKADKTDSVYKSLDRERNRLRNGGGFRLR